MSISKINTTFSSIAPQKNLRGFKGTEIQDNASEALHPEKLTQDELFSLASNGPRNRMKNVAQNALKTIFVAVPLVDSVFSGVVQKGNLSKKVFKSTATLGKWAGVMALASAFFGVKKALNSKSEVLRTLDKEHKVMSTGIDLGLLYLLMHSSFKYGAKLKSRVSKALPDVAKSFSKNIKSPLATFLDKSLINKKAVIPAEKFFAKNYYHSKAAKAISVLAAPALLIVAYTRVFSEAKTQSENVAINYAILNYINK